MNKKCKIGDFDPKNGKNIFQIIFFFTAAKNHTSNFADNPFGPDYYTLWVNKFLFFLMY